MKAILKRINGDQRGVALVLALVVLLVGGLITAGLLSHMGAGLLAQDTYNRRTAELYAADAGVEDAMWKIQNGDAPVCTSSPGPWCYEISDVNGRTVQICIEYDADAGTHRVTSTAATATSDGVADLSNTLVEAYVDVQYMDLASFLDNAIISDTMITISNDVNITGNVTSGGDVNLLGDGTDDDIDGTVERYVALDWPSAEDLSAYYLKQVTGGVHYYSDATMDLDGFCEELGPLYVDGTLDIKSSDQDQEATLTLSDTLYITGDAQIYGPANDEPSKLTIDLNGQTIFVASPSSKSSAPPDAKPALSIEKCNIIGSGCIIAVGDVYFAPKGNVGGENDFVLVMSIEGTTTLRPSGTFHGCIAGNLAVDVQSGSNGTIINSGLAEGEHLNFPTGVGDDPNNLPPVTGLRIDSWEISQG